MPVKLAYFYECNHFKKASVVIIHDIFNGISVYDLIDQYFKIIILLNTHLHQG